MTKAAIEIRFGACPHDCPDGCAMLYHVEQGKLVGVRGNPDHPFTQGRLCVKVKDYDQHHYHADRILYPLKRTGPKGSGEFEQISWEQALDEIKERWQKIINEFGAEAILPYGYAGNMGLLNGMNAGDAFFNRLGSSIGEKTFCASGILTAQLMTIGPTMGTDPESFVHSRFIILWGANTLSTNSHLWPFILAAQKQGAKVVVVDPYRSRTAAQADWHIPLRPGTDGALALAMIHNLIEENLIDTEYVEKYTVGFDELKASAGQYSPEMAEEITGIGAREIRRLAREYAETQPAVIRVGVGAERYPGGGQGIRAVDCLPALVGAWRHVGGGVLQMPVFVPVRFDILSRPDWVNAETRVVNLADIGNVLSPESSLEPPVKSLFIWNANLLSQAPDSNLVEQGLAREDLFTVVSEYFLTDTAHHADLVLPATMAGEHDDIVTSWGHFYIALNQKAIEPPGDAISNSELFRRLARCMGFRDERFTLSDEALLARSLNWDAPALAGLDFDTLKKQGYIRINSPDPDKYAPHVEGNFPTPTGKCEFTSLLGEQAGYVAPVLRQMCEDRQTGMPIAAVPSYIANEKCNRANWNSEFPLQLITPKSHAFLNSGYANVAHKLKVQGEQFALINPADANERGISHDEEIVIYNDKGEFSAEARVTDDVQPGVVIAPFGYWKSQNRNHGAANAMTTVGKNRFGGAPVYYDTNINIKRL